MTGNWTPGPWRVSDAPPTKARGYDILAGYQFLVGSGIGPNFLFDDEEQRRANAHLIAAAPDLYAALEAAYAFIADQYGDAEAQALQGEFVSKEARPVWDAICNALAKARGETK